VWCRHGRGPAQGQEPAAARPRLPRWRSPTGSSSSRGPEREAILAEAEHGRASQPRCTCPASSPIPRRYIGLFDIFALSSDSEQFPISLVEAMAAGVPAATTAVGDIPSMVADENRPFLARDEVALAAALRQLGSDAGLRERIGAANRAKARAEYDETGMIGAYARLYGAAIGRPGAFVTEL
jgi:glycosyltransferase involved in cell wall biosynthesis